MCVIDVFFKITYFICYFLFLSVFYFIYSIIFIVETQFFLMIIYFSSFIFLASSHYFFCLLKPIKSFMTLKSSLPAVLYRFINYLSSAWQLGVYIRFFLLLCEAYLTYYIKPLAGHPTECHASITLYLIISDLPTPMPISKYLFCFI